MRNHKTLNVNRPDDREDETFVTGAKSRALKPGFEFSAGSTAMLLGLAIGMV